MARKVKVTVYNILNRLTTEEIKLLAIKYEELMLSHRGDSVDILRKEYANLAKTYREAYDTAMSRDYVKTITYGKSLKTLKSA